MKLKSLFGVQIPLILGLAFTSGCGSDPEPMPEPEPEVVYEEPAPVVEDQPAPVSSEPGWGEADPQTVAIRGERNPQKRVIFLNDFGRGPALAVEDELEEDPEFVDILSDPTKANRVAIELTYLGSNLRRSLKRAIRKAVGFMFTFREAYLPKHLEVHRVKD
jgi:hypothetical protein